VIPLRDLNPTRTRPYLTWALIGVNVAVWLYEYLLGPNLALFVQRWGVIPYYLTQEPSLGSWLTPLTSMFMHGGWMHLIGNMWFLHIFGDNIEDELGRGRFLLFYLVCGLGAVALQVAIDPSSRVPMVGASGAIAGVLGGYMMLHPRARVVTLVPIVVFVQLVELPAWVFLFVWFGLQMLQGFTSLGVQTEAGGVAFFAHIGGFVIGLLLVRFLRRRTPPPSDPIEPELRRRPSGW
jgi:hypothetical protein